MQNGSNADTTLHESCIIYYVASDSSEPSESLPASFLGYTVQQQVLNIIDRSLPYLVVHY